MSIIVGSPQLIGDERQNDIDGTAELLVLSTWKMEIINSNELKVGCFFKNGPEGAVVRASPTYDVT